MSDRFTPLQDGKATSVIPKETLRDTATVLREMELNKDAVLNRTDLVCRVNVGKIVMPRSFKRHVEEVARLCDVHPNTIYQMFFMNNLEEFGDKLEAVKEESVEVDSSGK